MYKRQVGAASAAGAACGTEITDGAIADALELARDAAAVATAVGQAAVRMVKAVDAARTTGTDQMHTQTADRMRYAAIATAEARKREAEAAANNQGAADAEAATDLKNSTRFSCIRVPIKTCTIFLDERFWGSGWGSEWGSVVIYVYGS